MDGFYLHRHPIQHALRLDRQLPAPRSVRRLRRRRSRSAMHAVHTSSAVGCYESPPQHNVERRRTENLGFKNKVTNCRLEKCMSSGRVWSLCFSLALTFLPFEPFPSACFGRVIPAPRVTGAKSSLAVSFNSFSAGDKKPILNASFFSRFGLEAL